MIRKNVSSKKGSGIVEYILVTALMALAAISMFKTFREDIKEAYRKAGQMIVQGVQESAKPGSPAGE